jgi:hypothetical protein
LPVSYFHIVFTLPHELSALILQNKRLLYDLLFRVSAATLLELARDPKHLGGDMLSRCRDLLSAQGANEPDAPTHWRCPVCAGPMLIIERLTSSQLYFQSALIMPDSQRCSLDSS